MPTDGGLNPGLDQSHQNLRMKPGRIAPSNRSGISKKCGDLSEASVDSERPCCFSSGGPPGQLHPGDQCTVRRGKNHNLRESGNISSAAGRRVLLIDADMRRPTLQNTFLKVGRNWAAIWRVRELGKT